MKNASTRDGANGPDEARITALLYQALQPLGLLLPKTMDDIVRMEEEMADQSVSLPEALRDPFSALRKDRRSNVLLKSAHLDPQSCERLACAAREGGDIPPELWEQMHRDRDQAERDSNVNR